MKTYYQISGSQFLPKVEKLAINCSSLTYGGGFEEAYFYKRIFDVVPKNRQRPITEETYNYFKLFFEKKLHSIFYYNADVDAVFRADFDNDNKFVKQMFRWGSETKDWVEGLMPGLKMLSRNVKNLPINNFHISENEAKSLMRGNKKMLKLFKHLSGL